MSNINNDNSQIGSPVTLPELVVINPLKLSSEISKALSELAYFEPSKNDLFMNGDDCLTPQEKENKQQIENALHECLFLYVHRYGYRKASVKKLVSKLLDTKPMQETYDERGYE